MDMDPSQAHKGQENRRVLSVRTWLDAGKLSDLDRERMGGFQELVDDTTEYEVGEDCGKACKDDPLGGKSASSLTHLVWLQKLLFVVQRWKGKRG